MQDILDLQNKNEVFPEETPPTTLMHRLSRERRVGQLSALERILHLLSPGERFILYVLSVVLAGSALALLVMVNTEVSTTVPSQGGVLNEGAIGTPRFINPLLSISQVDQDLTTLVYSGLMRAEEGGEIVSDLSQSYEVSEDGTTYTFYIRPSAVFHDGHTVSAEDVVFTVSLAQNQDIKSPRRADWEGVSVHATDERTVVFTLPHAYAPFLENTQLGILPKHLWEGVTPDEFPFHTLNTHPVGSGPYEVTDVASNSAGAPLSYELSSFKNFTLGQPHLAKIVFHLFSNEDALMSAFNEQRIDSFAGISPDKISLDERPDTRMVRASSTRIFGIFFNQNHASVLSDLAVREALASAVNRKELIDTVLSGYGKETVSPIPPGLLEIEDAEATRNSPSTEEHVAGASAALSDGGWKFGASTTSESETPEWKKGKQTLSFALATADTPELVKTAQAVAEYWKKLGVNVEVQVYPLTEFNATVLRPRLYDAVLFGEVVGRTLDLFAFWHSSQRNDPGLNFALYANTRADRALADARMETNWKEREKLYQSFIKIIEEDKPAVFLYAPEFVYVVPNKLQNLALGALTSPSERLLNVHKWYTDTERVWDIFSSSNP